MPIEQAKGSGAATWRNNEMKNVLAVLLLCKWYATFEIETTWRRKKSNEHFM